MSAAIPLAANTAAPPLDLGRLLAPVPGASPAGEPIRDDDAYARLIETRRAENASLPQGVWKRDVKRADWRAVVEQAASILATRSKDLQVAAWLIEADVRLRGFTGLADTFDLVAGLCSDFWPTLYPPLDPTDPDLRNAPFEWLNEKLPILLQQVPLSRSGAVGEIAYSWTDYVNSQRHEVARQHDARAAARAEEAGRVTLAAFTDSAAQTPVSVVIAIYQDLEAARASVDRLQTLLDGVAGRTAPSLIGIIRQIEEIGNWAQALLVERHALPVAAEEPDEATNGRPASVEIDQFAPISAGPITSREQAYRQLAEAADYLFKTEPHSPVPYLVDRAIAWGQMPLHELLPEMTRGRGDLSLFMELFGIGTRQ